MNRHQYAWSLRGAVVVVLVALCGALGATRSWADDHRGRREDGRHGDIHHFYEQDLRDWRGGHWVHDRHDGRLGWWWIVGGMWYFYPAPVYPYPDPYVPPTVAPAPPASAPAQYWYYCAPVRAYYPYVTSCPGGWMQVVPPPTTPGPGG